MLERRKTRRGAGCPKNCKCGKGARGARREGHERGQEARTGSAFQYDIDHLNAGALLYLFQPRRQS
eukprot:2637515-Pleurochrysis_carterae.AAC.2